MGVRGDNLYILHPQDIRRSIREGDNFYIQFSLYTPEVEAQFLRLLHRYLERYDILYLKDVLIIVLKELITNGIKANTKRLYFSFQKLDISNTLDYRKGMETFKSEVYENESDIFEHMKRAKLAVRVHFEAISGNFIIKVINNTSLLNEELKKIDARIKKAYMYDDISEAFTDVVDDSEGAGLGLIIALMLLKNAGFPLESFSLSTNKGLTTARINIPQEVNRTEFNVRIADEILKEVDKIPSLPENILEIQKLCSNPKSTFKQIALSIKRDPGLTAAILKLANSAGYIILNKAKTIEEAVKIIGLRGINTLLIASGVQKIMDSRYNKFKAIWENSYKTAFYAQNISAQMRMTKLSQFAYLSALLADIGKIVLLSIKPDQTKRIKEIAGTKGFSDSDLLEEISLGISHSTLGGLICKKWRFNEALAETIEFHHRPYMAHKKYKELIYIVYLANIFTEIEDKKFRFEIIEEDVLEYFSLSKRDDFEMLHKILKSTYETHFSALGK